MQLATIKPFIPFFAFAAGLLGLGHLYVFGRIASYFGIKGKKKTLLICGAVFLFILQMATLALTRRLSHGALPILPWAAYTWMGALLLLAVCFGIADLLSLALRFSAKPLKCAADRRLFLKRMLGFSALIAGTLLTGTALWNNGLRRVAVKSVDVTLKKWPQNLDGFRIAQITDLHVGPIINGAWLRHIVDQTNALKADMIVITGDLIDGSVADLGEEVACIADLKAPQGVFFITGNHEYFYDADAWIAYIKSLGVHVLVNERVLISRSGATKDSFDLIGIEDHSADRYPGHASDLNKAVQGRDEARASILLAHQPISITQAADQKMDLQLSGHTHGGQIWPFGYAILLQQPYISGLHQHPKSETQIYVSNGTGFWGPPMRLCAPAEITDITIHVAA